MSMRRAAGWVLAVALMAATVGLSRFPLNLAGADPALIRLSWRIEGVTLEDCRALTPEELERLPVHMRNPAACRGRVAPYRLDVSVDGTLRVGDTLEAPGARSDRPITVYENLPAAPGEHRVRVSFRPLLDDDAAVQAATLRFDGEVHLDPREILLITHEEHRGALVVRGH